MSKTSKTTAAKASAKQAHAQPTNARVPKLVTPGQLDSIHRDAEQGRFEKIADLVEQMLSDDRVSACVSSLAAINGLNLSFRPVGEKDTPEKYPVSIALNADWWTMLPEAKLRELIGWGVVLGIACLYVKEWRQEESGRHVAQLEVWSPRSLTREAETGDWYTKTTGDVVRLADEPGRWFVWLPYGETRPTALAPCKGLALWWLLKRYAIADWGRYSERHGQGILVAQSSGPEAMMVTDDARRQLAASLLGMGSGGTVVPPPGFSIALVEATANTYETFERQTAVANQAISISLLGQNLTTEVQGGSYAAATVHDIVAMRILRSLTEGLSTFLRNGLVATYAQLNFGDNPAPYPSWDLSPPVDTAAELANLNALGSASRLLQDAGYPIDVEVMAERHGIPLGKFQGQIYAYHLQYGVFTKNEIRQRLGYDSIKGGDIPPIPTQGGPTVQARLGTGDILAKASGFTDGQQYIDDLSESAIMLGAKAMKSSIEDILDAIAAAETPEELRAKLYELHEGSDPKELEKVLEQANILAQLAGRDAVITDL